MFNLSWAEAHRLPWKPVTPLDPLELHETVSKRLVYLKVEMSGVTRQTRGKWQEMMSESKEGWVGVGWM